MSLALPAILSAATQQPRNPGNGLDKVAAWELAAKAGKTAAPVENFRPPSGDEGTTYTSPSIGLTAGQTARLSVVNNGDTEETETLSIVDSNGRTVATETLAIAPGSVGSLDYSSPGDIHGVIPCIFPASLQIINARTNRTVSLVENFQPPSLDKATLT